MGQQPLFIVFIHLGLGGVERKIVNIVNRLKNDRPNLPIYILLRKSSTFSIENQIKNKHVTIVAYTDWMKIKIPFFFIGFVLFHIWKLKPKAILAFLDLSAYAAVIAKYVLFWRKIRVIIGSDHYASRVIARYNYPTLRLLLVTLLYPHADRIITCTKATKIDLIDSFHIPPYKIKIIKNWTSQRLTALSHKRIYDFIYAGRLEKEKNVLGLLQTILPLMMANKKLSMLVVGDGPQRGPIQLYVKKQNLSDNIQFTGAVKNVKQYLLKARLFIYSPNQQADGFPITLLESMSVGVPVLTRYFDGVDEVIQNDVTGCIVHSKKEFIQKTLWLLEHPEVRKQIAVQAKKYVAKYHTPANMLGYFDELKI